MGGADLHIELFCFTEIREFLWSLKVFRAYRKSCANPSRRTWQPFYLKAEFCRTNCKKGYDMRKIDAKYSIKLEKNEIY